VIILRANLKQLETHNKNLSEFAKKLPTTLRVTPVGALVVISAITFFLIGLFSHNYLILFLSYILVFLFLVDLRNILRISLGKVEFKRRVDKKSLFLNGFTYVELTVKNNNNFSIDNITVQDLFPVVFEEVAGISYNTFSVPKQGSALVSYIIQAKRRGIYQIGPIRIVLKSPFSLFFIERMYPLYDEIIVYPSIERSEKMYFMAKTKRSAKFFGMHRSKTIGSGTDFFGLREYTRYDDYRAIDWKASARTMELMVREFTIEVPLNIVLMIDSSYSMGYGKPISKLDYSIDTALMLAKIALDQHDRVGLLIYADDVKSYIPPKSDRNNVNLMLREFALARPEGGSGYLEAIRYAVENLRMRTMFIIMADLEGDIDEFIEAIKIARLRKHKVFVMHMYTPYFVTADSKEKPLVRRAAEAIMFDRYEKQRAYLRHELLKRGVNMITVMPQIMIPLMLERYLKTLRGVRL